jgi:hypothetical protein
LAQADELLFRLFALDEQHSSLHYGN